jgi:hypothetical protein
MSSKSRETRENQKKMYEQQIQERKSILEKKGITPKDFKKDNVYAHLQADLKSVMKAIAAINDSDMRNANRGKAGAETAAAEASKEKKPKKEASKEASAKPEKPAKAAPPEKTKK